MPFFFSSVYDGSNYQVPLFEADQRADVILSPVSRLEIYDKLSKLSNKMSTGPDQIPNLFLKRCVCTLVQPLYLIFNSSIAQGIFPEVWKESYIVPLFKSGDRQNIRNYRGVCNQSTMAKVLDSLVYDQLRWQCKNLINPNQHGFCQGRSTSTNLVEYEVDLLEVLEGGGQVDAVYTDFAKAFDRVNFNILISKLKSVGFNQQSLCWIESFLTGRTQRVKVNNYLSNKFSVVSGVPQGSHCSPLLFNMFINDISNIFQYAKSSLYADDLKLYMEIKTLEDSIYLQNDLDALWRWSKLNGLQINRDKCFYISFYKKNYRILTHYNIDGASLKYEPVVKDLGVWFDERITFNEHVVRISQKSLKMLGFICRNSQGLSVNVSKTLYIALVRSNLEYATLVWTPHYQAYINVVERVQEKFLRVVAFKMGIRTDDYHRSDMLERLNLLTLQKRRVFLDACFVFKILIGLVDSSKLLSKIKLNIPSFNLRHRELFYIDFHGTNYGSHSPINRTLRVLNTLYNSVDFFNISLAAFKRLVKREIRL